MSDRERQILYDLTYVWNWKASEQASWSYIDGYREHTGSCGTMRVGSGQMD